MSDAAGVKGIAIGAVLVLALAAAGCGGGGSKTLSKEEYGSQLNQICGDATATLDKVGRPGSIPELASKGPKLIDEFDKAVSKAEALKPPSEIEADAGRFVSKSKQLRGVLGQLVDAAKKNAIGRIAQLAVGAESLGNDVGALGRKLGAPACAQLASLQA
jgi:hypothetical protein